MEDSIVNNNFMDLFYRITNIFDNIEHEWDHKSSKRNKALLEQEKDNSGK